jgi:D-aminopeptidase
MQKESGLLRSPIIITNSFSVGACYTGVYQYAIREHADKNGLVDWFLTPVIAETYDGYLNDIAAMTVTPDMVVRGIDAASSDRVLEGCTGGGTGMTCSGYKSGTGSASRVIKGANGEILTVAALVQSNFGKDWDLKFGGVPVGRVFMDQDLRKRHEANLESPELQNRLKEAGPQKDGSIITIIATDAPLNPTQLKRLAKRGATGVARVGGWGSNHSGDIFLAFSTGADIVGNQDMNWNPVIDHQPQLVDNSINAVFECAADCVEESIYNSICMAETTVGPEGRKADAIDLDRLRSTLEKWYCTE